MECIISTIVKGHKCSNCNNKLDSDGFYLLLTNDSYNQDIIYCNADHEIILCKNCLEESLGDSGLDVLKIIAEVL